MVRTAARSDDGETRDGGPARTPAALARLRDRAAASLPDRLRRVRAGGGLAVQAGLAAGLAWWVADNLLHIPQPLFAPISAVVALAASVGQRIRRTVELIVGVSVGVLIGDALIYLVGTGVWQLGLIVVLSIVVSVLLGGGPSVMVQAGATAVLIG
ncbi:aromatic acid exporter family protein, partial [Micromonospora sp. WP24]|uniref:FUSC family protein n=1 Tax=Micromonospora sp. WP24 TaxID=2604469 RepID=UPI0011D48C2A